MTHRGELPKAVKRYEKLAHAARDEQTRAVYRELARQAADALEAAVRKAIEDAP
jgi:hypothetical protein